MKEENKPEINESKEVNPSQPIGEVQNTSAPNLGTEKATTDTSTDNFGDNQKKVPKSPSKRKRSRRAKVPGRFSN